MSEVAPRNSLFPGSTRWEIGGKIFAPCFFRHPSEQYKDYARVELLVKRGEAQWESLWQSNYMWNDLKDQLGVDGMLKSCLRNMNPAIARELNLSFEAQLNIALGSGVKMVGPMLVEV